MTDETESVKKKYREELERNILPIPSSLILEYNWKNLSFWEKIKYFILYKDLGEAKLQAAIDYRMKSTKEEINKYWDNIEAYNTGKEFASDKLKEIIKKHNIDLNSSNTELKKFLLDVYCSQIINKEFYHLDNGFDIFKCYFNEMGHRGRCYREKNGPGVILIFTEFFQDWLKYSPERKEIIVNDYIRTLLHEFAHYLCEPYLDHDENPHGHKWKEIMVLLGINDIEYINAMEGLTNGLK